MKYVFVKDGVVTDVAQVNPATVFQPAYAKQFIQAADEVTHWWKYDGKVFTPPTEYAAAPAAPTKEQLMAELAALTAKIQALE